MGAAALVLLGCSNAPADPEPASESSALDADDGVWGWFFRRCHDDDDCFRGGVCDRTCDGDTGMCVRQRDECPTIWRPQCGCDGVTYRNRCERVRAGVDLAHRGVCETDVCGGIAGEVCDEGEVCLFEVGSCGDGDQQGICIDQPEVCPDIWQPVCGCDGVTYGNRCEALAAGFSIRHFGACETRCKDNSMCADDEWCKKDGCWGDGMCAERPQFCTDDVNPVCSCDGVTYFNACTAWQNGANIAHRGACEPRECGGTTGYMCEEGEFCDPKPGLCAIASPLPPPGHCVDVHDACDTVYAPVCGCDGVTYDNDCVRIQHKVGKMHDGTCDRVCGGIIGVGCPDGQFCDLPPGTCNGADFQGVCVEQGDVCITLHDPVCGCDGVTYDNDCLRIAAGVQKDHDGSCHCCPAATEPGVGDNPMCFEGHSCCASGEWHCNDAMAQPTCDRLGEVCP